MHITFEQTASGQGQALIEGELTIFYANAMKQEVLTLLAKVDELELDLWAVSEIDTAGLQVLMAAKTDATEKKKQLKLVSHSPAVVDLLNLSNLSGFFGDPILLSKADHRTGEHL